MARRVVTYLSEELAELLAARAAGERRSVSAMAGLLLAEALDAGSVEAVPVAVLSTGSVVAETGEVFDGKGRRVGKVPPVRKCPMYVPAGTKCKSCGKVH